MRAGADEVGHAGVALERFAQRVLRGGLVAEVEVTERETGEPGGIVGNGLGGQALAFGPILEPREAALAVGQIRGSEGGEVARISFHALRFRPLGGAEEPTARGKLRGNCAGDQLVAADTGMHVVDIPIVTGDAVGTTRSDDLGGVDERCVSLGGDAEEGVVQGCGDAQRTDVGVLGPFEIGQRFGGAAQPVKRARDAKIQESVVGINGGGFLVDLQGARQIGSLGGGREIERGLPAGLCAGSEAGAVFRFIGRAITQIGAEADEQHGHVRGAARGDDLADGLVVLGDDILPPHFVTAIGRVAASVVEAGVDVGA